MRRPAVASVLTMRVHLVSSDAGSPTTNGNGTANGGNLGDRSASRNGRSATRREAHRRGLFGALAALSAATLVLSGCAPEGSVPSARFAPGASAAQQRNFPELYQQQPEWGPCGTDAATRDAQEAALRAAGARIDGMECANITVPLDWNDAANPETITLRAVFIPATGPGDPLGTLFSNPGGPGASGIEYTVGMTVAKEYAPLQERYNFLGFDPRGMGASTPLTCTDDSSILELNLAKCADEAPLARSMGSTQVARDLDLMRHLMGDEKLNYAGLSYGTVIGASYTTLFPERVGRVMLDSAWPSDWSSPLGSYLQAEAFTFATADLLEQCGVTYRVATCPVTSEAALLSAVQRLQQQPLVASDGTAVTGTMYRKYLDAGLYQLQHGREQVLDIAGRALGGDQAAIDALAAAMAGGGAKVGLAGMVVRCLSSPRDPGVMNVYRYIQEHGLPVPLGGPEITDETLKPWIDLSCDALPNSGDDYLDFVNTGDQPVLVFGITGDPATPYAGAVQIVEELGNARLVTVEGRGHIATFNGRSPCTDAIANAYFLRGELPAEGTVCTDR